MGSYNHLIMRVAVLFVFGLFDVSFGYRACDFIQETNISETSLRRNLENMAKLSQIQEQLLPKSNGQNLIGRRPSSSDFTPLNMTDDVQTKPDQIPYLFEGDIVLTDDQMNEILKNAEDQLWATVSQRPRMKRSMTSSLSLRWTFPIPYYISTSTGVSESAVLAGIARWQTDTCATFTRLSTLPVTGNALNFILGQGCYSYIGKVGSSPQTISIGIGCTSLGTTTHEIGHALGFFHEQARYDRDSYVAIVTQNIQSIYLSQFSKQSRSSMVDYGVPYDLGSVMHYDQFAFSANGGQTIQTTDTNYQMTIGQRLAPSFADVKRINLAYCNSSCSTALDCQNGGYTDPKNCQQCRCADGFGGTLCERAANAPSACGVGDLSATDQLQTIQASGALNCPYVITAPEGKKIFFQLGVFSFTYWTPCSIDYLEIKYSSDFVITGARFCRNFPTNSLSETNRLVVIYKGSANSRFSLSYRYDPPTPIVSTTTPATTTLPSTTTESTTTSTTTTTTESTTALPSTTTESTTSLPPTQSTTTIATSTVPTTSSTSPSTTQRTIPTTRRTRTTRHFTTTRPWRTSPLPSVTTTSVTRPSIWTFYPQPTTVSPVKTQCTSWSACTALCGGCGTTTRRCGGQLETKHCNVQPCTNSYCCLPFFYVKQNLCVKPYSDEELIAAFSHSTDEEILTMEASGQQP